MILGQLSQFDLHQMPDIRLHVANYHKGIVYRIER